MTKQLTSEHFWLYRKLFFVRDRDRSVFLRLHDVYGGRFENATGRSLNDYREGIPETALEELAEDIDPDIFLHEAFEEAERHEAGLVAAVTAEWEEEGLSALVQQMAFHGRKVAAIAEAEMEKLPKTARDVFELLINYFYDGFPGDGSSLMAEIDDDRLLWRHDLTLHRPAWEAAGANEGEMVQALSAWLAGLLNGLGLPFGYICAMEDRYLYAVIARPEPTAETLAELRTHVEW